MMSIDDRYKSEGNIPNVMRDAFVLYIERGIAPGHFLLSVLRNDLREACGWADAVNRARLYQIVHYLHEYAPAACWGDPKTVAAWMGHRGFDGWDARHREPKVPA
jgi:hypothetical protein